MLASKDLTTILKVFLVIQLIINAFVMQGTIFYVFRASDFSNILISMMGILIMSEIDTIFGLGFKIHLETYHIEILEDKSFMTFKCTKRQKEIAYLWILILFTINFLGAFFLSAYMGSTVCPNFEEFLKQYL